MNYVTNQPLDLARGRPINYLTQIKDFFLDLLFPKYCVECSKEGEWICKSCLEKIVFIKQPTCPNCHRITANSQFCQKCKKSFSLNGVITAAYYENGPLKEAIHVFKYEGVFDLKNDLGGILTSTLKNSPFPNSSIIIPVPLHKRKRAQRGYNQAELLVSEVTNSLNYQINTSSLERTKQTQKNQVELSGKARRINVIGAFSWVGNPNELKGKMVILVDDVYTTGATLNECAKILKKQAGARAVWALVLAKA